ncbi:unnamed protein product [Nezara viridula]|uniref:Uncharacterized protein n=1 Tax=Nezara viridula TaxID=85310 RepID=A0A9P0E404_NEZVI|nr:unnamed protein product [Nezara viridula]
MVTGNHFHILVRQELEYYMPARGLVSAEQLLVDSKDSTKKYQHNTNRWKCGSETKMVDYEDLTTKYEQNPNRCV